MFRTSLLSKKQAPDHRQIWLRDKFCPQTEAKKIPLTNKRDFILDDNKTDYAAFGNLPLCFTAYRKSFLSMITGFERVSIC